MVGFAPNRNLPPDAAKHSRQIVTMRSISAWAPVQTLKFGYCPLMFIGRADRKLLKPECISPEIDRQWARATGSRGSRAASGHSSFKYSAMASVSHTLTFPVVSEGTRK